MSITALHHSSTRFTTVKADEPRVLMQVAQVITRGHDADDFPMTTAANVILRGKPSDPKVDVRLGDVRVLLTNGESLPGRVVLWDAMSTGSGIVLLALGLVVEHPELCRAAESVRYEVLDSTAA